MLLMQVEVLEAIKVGTKYACVVFSRRKVVLSINTNIETIYYIDIMYNLEFNVFLSFDSLANIFPRIYV